MEGNLALDLSIFKRLRRAATLKNLRGAMVYTRGRGPKVFLRKVFLKRRHYDESDPYSLWIKLNEPDEKQLARHGRVAFRETPVITLVTLIRSDEEPQGRLIESLMTQTYKNWELVVIRSAHDDTPPVHDRRVKVISSPDPAALWRIPRTVAGFCSGTFIGYVAPTDEIAPFALFEVVSAMNHNKDMDCVYSDNDFISHDGATRSDPCFKPDWSPDLLRSCNYIGSLFLVRRGLLEKIESLEEGAQEVGLYDLVLQSTEKARVITHIPKVLCHTSRLAGSDPGLADSRNIIGKHLKRTGVGGHAVQGVIPGTCRTVFQTPRNRNISIIIPNKDHGADLEKCVTSITKKSTYGDYEIWVVENGSREDATFDIYSKLTSDPRVKIVEWNAPFNYSALNNFAVSVTHGDLILFLNNDVEVISPDWLERMSEYLVRKDVGAVGAKLYYPDGMVQHGGIVISIAGVADHAFRGYAKDSTGYLGQLKIARNVSAVTAACLMTRRDVFEEIGGFDESLVVAYNDIDFCLRLREKGYLIIWTPWAELCHHEYKTRGYPTTSKEMKRERKEIGIYQKRWKHLLRKGDPYYNVNLNGDRADFTIAFP